jgi:hypothetical protein
MSFNWEGTHFLWNVKAIFSLFSLDVKRFFAGLSPGRVAHSSLVFGLSGEIDLG